MIHLAGRLIEPFTPGVPAVERDYCALVCAFQDSLRIIRIDPEHVIVFATWLTFPGREGLAAIDGAIRRSLHHVNHIGVFRIYIRTTEIAATNHSWIFVTLLPRRAAVVRAKETLIQNRVNALAFRARRDRHTDSTPRIVRQARAADWLPRRAPISRFVNLRLTYRWPSAGRIDLKRIGRRVYYSGVVRRGAHINNCGLVIFEKDSVPGFAPVRCLEQTALRTSREDVKTTNQHNVRIARIDDDRRDVVDISQSDIHPSHAGVSGLVDSIAFQIFTCADIDHIRIRSRDRQCADRRHMRVVKNRLPNPPAIHGLPQPAARRAEIIARRLAGNSCDRCNSTGAVRANETPLHGGEEIRVVLLAERGSCRY